MQAAGIPEGPHRCPKGLRHGYAIHALSKSVPLNMVPKWMGRFQMETTAIYAMPSAEGVELGKVLAQRIISAFESTAKPTRGHDSSANNLIRRYRTLKEML
jgi:site-specific recombinase XerD